jgi:SAM-dependent methyltransferase
MPQHLPTEAYALLCCPIDRAELDRTPTSFVCRGCGTNFGLNKGVPVLLDPSKSLFARANESEWSRSESQSNSSVRIKRFLRRWRPSLGLNLAAGKNYKKVSELALLRGARPTVLVVGGAEIGKGFDEFLSDSRFMFIESDIYFGKRVNLIADGHQLPLKNSSIDVIVCQAVLHHVADPFKCVDEMWRVLRPEGILYAEVPFMQQVHGSAYDFTRFSTTGCRRLFRQFREDSVGMVAGPGTALAWSVEYFLRSFSDSSAWRRSVHRIIPIFLFWLKYFDYLFQHVKAGQDAASCSFFLGQKATGAVSDGEIVAKYASAL